MPHKFSFTVPEHACNAHLHIIDPSYPNDGKAAAQAGTVETYRQVAEEIGMDRAVFVQAKVFSKDNTCLLDAIKSFGPENAVGIAVVDNMISDKELEELNKGGIRGIRFSVWNPANAVVTFDDCYPLSERIKTYGWNVQLHMGASQLVQYADVIRKLDCKIVIDHMGRLDPALGIKDPAYRFICEMIEKGNTWVKLSGPYLNTLTGEPWEDASAVARAIASYAPERVIFGTDFPHVTEKIKPVETQLVEMIADWLPTEKARRLALVENPQELYGFAK